MKKQFQLHGYDEKRLSKMIETVRKMEREVLLKDKVKEIKDADITPLATESIISLSQSILADDVRLKSIFK